MPAVDANFQTVDVGMSYLKAARWQRQATGLERRGLISSPRRVAGLAEQLEDCSGQLLSASGQPLDSVSQPIQVAHLLSSQPLRVVALGARQAPTRESAERMLLAACGAVLVGIVTADELRGKVELVSRLQQLAADLVLFFGDRAGAGADGSWPVGLLEGLALSNQSKQTVVIYSGSAQTGLLVARLLGQSGNLHILPQAVEPQEAIGFARAVIAGLVEQRLRSLCAAAGGRLANAEYWQTAVALERAVAAYSAPDETSLVIDLGGEMTEVITSRQSRLASTSSPYGLDGGLLRAADNMDIVRLGQWLGHALDRRDWLDACGNRSLRAFDAQANGVTQPMLKAMAREIIRLALIDRQSLFPAQLIASPPRQTWWEQLGPEIRPPISPTRIVGTGGLFAANCTPDEAASILLDGVRPAGVVSVYRDRDAIWPQLGALQQQWPTSVASLLSASLELLCTAICPFNFSPKSGQLLEVKISGNHSQSLTLQAGDLFILGNTAGQMWEVELRPIREVDVGAGPGISVLHRLSGGTIGLTFDCRGWPKQQRRRSGRDA